MALAIDPSYIFLRATRFDGPNVVAIRPMRYPARWRAASHLSTAEGCLSEEDRACGHYAYRQAAKGRGRGGYEDLVRQQKQSLRFRSAISSLIASN